MCLSESKALGNEWTRSIAQLKKIWHNPREKWREEKWSFVTVEWATEVLGSKELASQEVKQKDRGGQARESVQFTSQNSEAATGRWKDFG